MGGGGVVVIFTGQIYLNMELYCFDIHQFGKDNLFLS